MDRKDRNETQDGMALNDRRVGWMIQRVVNAFGSLLKKKDVDRLDDDNAGVILKEYVESKDLTCLYAFINNMGLMLSVDPVEDFGNRKVVYFLKKEGQAITSDNIGRHIEVGELCPKPLQSLLYSETHINPALLNLKQNVSSIPAVSRPQLMDKISGFRSLLMVTQGLAEGQCQLPVPIIEKGKERDKDLTYQLESVIVSWTSQIKQAISICPASLFNTDHPRTKGIPSTKDEIQFWKLKASDLLGIEDQINENNVLRILKILSDSGSSYSKPFQLLKNDLRYAANEAVSNSQYLEPPSQGARSPIRMLVGPHAVSLDTVLEEHVFEKYLHYVYLLWEHSKHYNTANRIVVFIKEFCNDIITNARSFLSINELFQIDADEAILRLKSCLHICTHFKNMYFAQKAKVAKESTVGPWRFHNSALFARLDAFLERVHDLLDIFDNFVVFQRLSPDSGKVIIGGNAGAESSQVAYGIYYSFVEAHRNFSESTDIDLLDVEDLRFDEIFSEFRTQIRNLDHQLSGLIAACADEALADNRNNLTIIFRLVETFDIFLDRPAISQIWATKQVAVIQSYETDLLNVQQIYQSHIAQARRTQDHHVQNRELIATATGEGGTMFPVRSRITYDRSNNVYDNMPPVVADVSWAKALLDRIDQPLAKLHEVITKSVQSTPLWESTIQLSETLSNTFQQYINTQANTWVGGIAETQDKLQLCLITRNIGGKLQVSFDGELSRLLREVTYVEGINANCEDLFEVPASASKIDAITLRRQILRLDDICSTYNNINNTILDVECPLLEGEIGALDEILSKGIHDISWVSLSTNDFIVEASHQVQRVHLTLETIKDNRQKIEASLNEHLQLDTFLPLDPKESRVMSLQDFTIKYTQNKEKRRLNAVAVSSTVSELVSETLKALNHLKETLSLPLIDPESCERWGKYILFLNNVVEKIVIECIHKSLSNLRDQLDGEWLTANSGLKLLDVKLTLTDGVATFQPNISGSYSSLDHAVDEWAREIKQASKSFNRLDDSEENFYSAVQNDASCEEVCEKITKLVITSVEETEAFRQQYLNYSYLWETEMEDAFAAFLKECNKNQSTENIQNNDLDSTDGDAPHIDEKQRERHLFSGATIEDYRSAIVRYSKVQEEIATLPDGQGCAWLWIDTKPLKLLLKDLSQKWKETYINHIISRVKEELTTLQDFVIAAQGELERQVTDGDQEGLKSLMKWVRDCKRLNATAKHMFEPVSVMIDMLKRNASISEDTMQELETLRREVPDTWQQCYKRSLTVREEVGTIQDQEADRVDEQATAFQKNLIIFQQEFHQQKPFQYLEDTDEAYAYLDEMHRELTLKEEEASRINDEQELFDLAKAEFKVLKECRTNLRNCKGVWDLICHVRALFDYWYQLSFIEVDVNDLSDEIGKLMKQLKVPSSTVRSWRCFEGVAAEIKQMESSIPLTQDLREDSIRERHWSMLFKETGANKKIDPRSPSCTLRDLMSQGLHNHQEAIQIIVEKANKELQLETYLNKIQLSWEGLAFQYRLDDELHCWILGTPDDIIDILDQDSNLLHQIQSNRFVEHFQDPLNRWIGRLATVESTLQVWLDVQRRWANLHPIFIKSEDIRISLPRDSFTFEGADSTYRELMDHVNKCSNVIQVCCTDFVQKAMNRGDGIEAILTSISDILKQCEKSLADYLEAKKRLFPRFFFLADADLVDILSRGSTPSEVMVHMSKLVDAVETFEFFKEEDKRNTIMGFTSIQGEEVTIPQYFQYNCVGAVEEWLGGCIDSMRKTIKQRIDDANTTYMENPRPTWIFNHCCQAVIVTSRTQFTWETSTAFAQLEDGNESAMRDHLRSQQKQLSSEIKLVLGTLSPTDRAMLVHLITIDVHNRDVIQNLIEEKAENETHFKWQSQLRYTWEDTQNPGVVIKICDSEFSHGYEYIGLCGCLVVTKLTDRCYITLTQALKLVQGGAPAGPAGTGKTETTKDLARNLGVACYVFNCSDQMDYFGLGRIFKGLAMSGCWGCFDEFNRISIEVLSVVATQVSSVLYGIRTQKKQFRFANEETISLNPTCGIFITMNPGYAGRTELPENIKSLFRPCAMVVPDIRNISEILLAAEGFVDAKDLALKFVQLYKLNKELLSEQLHYDWGLRAVKSVLLTAGNLRRLEPDMNEKHVLLRALRDSNLAKLSRDDIYVFMGLLRALFPNVTVARKADAQLRRRLSETCTRLQLMKGDQDIFIEKCLQYDELLSVRHSVFILGPAGCGKTEVRNTLKESSAIPVKFRCINPKAITADEMYGCLSDQTKEWKEGHLAHIFKEYNMLSKTSKCWKWIVLDGIIDAGWIESMNTVMDDNKILTLANNDRISLASSMKMVFEVSQLHSASPATVSRAGILYINDTDIGWAPFKDRWLLSLNDEKRRNALDTYFDYYLHPVFDQLKKAYSTVIPVVETSIIQSLCRLLDALLAHLPSSTPQEVYERYFTFATVWSFGSALPSEGRLDYKAAFSKWWTKEMQAKVRICEDKHQIYDFYISPETGDEFRPWAELVPPYRHNNDSPVSSTLVNTADTVKYTYIMDLLLMNHHPVLVVGKVGTGKSLIVNSMLKKLNPQQWMSQMISLNAETSAKTLQHVMESKLERGGRIWHPPGRKKMVFFIEDLNMPRPDQYGTQEPIALLRQYLDYQFWLDRNNPGVEKHITDIQFFASMNHKAGTFTVLDRFTRWFTVMAIELPTQDDLELILSSVLSGHWKGWSRDTVALIPNIASATVELHQAVREHFLPTATKFHYRWNLREFINIIEGMNCTVKGLHDGDAAAVLRLWRHECERTFRDRMVDDQDSSEYDALSTQIIAKHFSDMLVVEDILKEPNMWAPFGQHNGEFDIYDSVESFSQLQIFLEEKLSEYNNTVTRSPMQLVLFNQAMQHTIKICRILSRPKGNALLIGVGGSGKRSLSKLSAFINDCEISTIQLTANYSGVDFRSDIGELYLKCGRKNQKRAFIITDTQIVHSDQLVVLNDLLNSGFIPDLFDPDTIDDLTNAMVPELRQRHHPDFNNRDVCMDFFISRVQTNLHSILCFSPVGSQLATWCRHFPSLATTTKIDWFHSWQDEALTAVAKRFLVTDEDKPKEQTTEPVSEDEVPQVDKAALTVSVSDCISEIHLFVTKLADEYRIKERRFCYTTPKSYMELISAYNGMLRGHEQLIEERRNRLLDGIQKIHHAKEQVQELQNVLIQEDVEVRNATTEVSALMDQVSVDKVACQEEAEKANIEKEKTGQLLQETNALRCDAERDLEVAQPLVERAKAALGNLNKASLTELKSFTKPPQEVLMVTAAVMCLTADPNRIPKPEKAKEWSNAKKMMANVSNWLKELEQFSQTTAHDIPQQCIDAIQIWVQDPEFDAERMSGKSAAASCLAAWVTNMDAYHTLRCQVRPKEERLQEAIERLETSTHQYKKVQEHVDGLNQRLNNLVEQHNAASERSRLLKQKAESTRLKMNLAERLVSGLADENIRWAKTTNELADAIQLLPGDVLLASAFVSYAGPFNLEYREKLNEHIRKEIRSRGIPHSEGQDVLHILTSEVEVAGWNNEGLPSDRVSTENGAIVKSARRWPLLIDPQLQGVRWIKTKEKKHGLVVTQQSNKSFLSDLCNCLEKGLPCLIENLPEDIDPIISPILGKEFSRQKRVATCQLGDKDICVDVSSFRLYLQTKHPNPHFKPEINAQTTLVNFMVTEAGLDDQLLAVVVNRERPELEERRVSIIRKMNLYKIDLAKCEDNLLFELSNAQGDLLENVVLISNLEQNKKQAGMIAKALVEDIQTQEELMVRRLAYKPAAQRGTLLYTEISKLSKVNSIYQYSLEAFMSVFSKAITKSPWPQDDEGNDDTSNDLARVRLLIKTITETLYAYVSRGLFERHKIVFSSLLCFSILKQQGEIDGKQLDFLLTGGKRYTTEPPPQAAEWCSSHVWSSVCALADVSGPVSKVATVILPTFDQLPEDIQQHNRWRMWAENSAPEDEKLPTDWRNFDSFQRLLILRCLRPDRMIAALQKFVAAKLGSFFIADSAAPLSQVFSDVVPTTPILFLLSPGVDPVTKVETLAEEKGFSYEAGNFFNVSLGQGQESKATDAIDQCFTKGGFVMLSNIHLTTSWLHELEKILDYQAECYASVESKREQRERRLQERERRKKKAEKEMTPENEDIANEGTEGDNENEEEEIPKTPTTEPVIETDLEEDDIESDSDDLKTPLARGHRDYRLFLSAQPAPGESVIPITILQRCIKLTSEPPSGVKANMLRALAEFKDEPWENSCKPADFKAVLFAMCWFHSIIVERKKFGKLGWNREYPFNMGDLSSCIDVLNNYMEDRPAIPWDALRYTFGEIIYGGHIIDDWDRRLCGAYLEEFIKIEVTEGSLELCPGLAVPHYGSYSEAVAAVDHFPPESPLLYGLHSHAELGYHTSEADELFQTILHLQPRQSNNGEGYQDTVDQVQLTVDEILNNYLQDAPHNLLDLAERLEDDKTPQQHVFYQECERTNMLQQIVRSSLVELSLGLKGSLSMSDAMLDLFESVRLDQIPKAWVPYSFESCRPLISWCQSLVTRNSQLIDWTSDLVTPKVTRLDFLFNPMSFLTSIAQYTAISSNYELDQMDLVCDPLKRMADAIEHTARDGCHVFGLKMEGARWDVLCNTIEDSKHKEIFCVMPVLTIRSLPNSKIDRKDEYQCPLYKTQLHRAGSITPLYLRTKQPAIKWIIAGVSCVLDVADL